METTTLPTPRERLRTFPLEARHVHLTKLGDSRRLHRIVDRFCICFRRSEPCFSLLLLLRVAGAEAGATGLAEGNCRHLLLLLQQLLSALLAVKCAAEPLCALLATSEFRIDVDGG